MRAHKPVGRLRLWWRVKFTKKRSLRVLQDLLDRVEKEEGLAKAECPYCHEILYASSGRDPLHHHDEYCPEWPYEE